MKTTGCPPYFTKGSGKVSLGKKPNPPPLSMYGGVAGGGGGGGGHEKWAWRPLRGRNLTTAAVAICKWWWLGVGGV